jgi:hypothetical protein
MKKHHGIVSPSNSSSSNRHISRDCDAIWALQIAMFPGDFVHDPLRLGLHPSQ